MAPALPGLVSLATDCSPACTPGEIPVELPDRAGFRSPAEKEEKCLLSGGCTPMPTPIRLLGSTLPAESLLIEINVPVSTAVELVSAHTLHVSFLACRNDFDIENSC